MLKIEQYFFLRCMSNTNLKLTDKSRITVACFFLTRLAVSQWYTVVQASEIPITWEGFKNPVLPEFIPSDQVCQAGDRLRKLWLNCSVSSYVSELRNCTLKIGSITEGEKSDRFVKSLKDDIKLKLLESQFYTFEEATKISLWVDSAI